MLTVTSVAGNIASRRLAAKYRRATAAGKIERLLVSRMEMERLRLRRRTDKGTDIGIVLEPGSRLHHGDFLTAKKKFIVVEQLPEKVVLIRIKKDSMGKMVGLAALIGHVIGNRHRPIAVHHDTISFPVQIESEVDAFRKLLPHDIQLKVTKQVFFPAGEVHAHE